MRLPVYERLGVAVLAIVCATVWTAVFLARRITLHSTHTPPPPSLLHQIDSFLKAQQAQVPSPAVVASDTLLVELNSATEQELLKLPGVTTWLARQIIRYKEALGGFYTAKQLTEVYGLDSATWELIEEHVVVNPFAVRKIDLNRASVRALAHHPYISWELAQAIDTSRRHQPFVSSDELISRGLVPLALYLKLRPYLTVISTKPTDHDARSRRRY